MAALRCMQVATYAPKKAATYLLASLALHRQCNLKKMASILQRHASLCAHAH